MFKLRDTVAVLAFATACTTIEADEGLIDQEVGQSGPVILINEFTAGSSGRIELYNAGDVTVDLSNWLVDDIVGGYAPKSLGTSVSLAPGARLVIAYAGINHASTDQVRLVDQTGLVRDTHSNFYAGSSILGQCFGRQPDGGDWATGAVTCSLGTTNGCATNGACEDGDLCTIDETVQANCACGGGVQIDCNDDNPCTADSCDALGGCRSDAVPDGTSCGSNGTCRAGACTAPTPPHAELLSLPRRDRVRVLGVVVTPDVAFTGEVLIDGDTIACVATSCASHPSAGDAAIVRTNGVIFPGLVDAHNHILFNIFDETDWSPSKIYTNHNQWPNEARYKALVDTKQALNGETSTTNLGCEMNKYGELKALIAGTTAVQGSANPADKQCYGSIARTIDQAPNDLGFDRIQTATIFPSRTAADAVCNNMASGKTDAYAIHIAEGVDATALNEFTKLGTITTNPQCFYNEKTTIVHGTALGDPELSTVATRGMSIVWSPRSNVFLYGGGTDLTKTTNIPVALAKGINIAIAPDWSIGGSQNMLDELRFADHVDNTAFGDLLTPQEIVQMGTINAARALGVDHVLGSIEVGKKADLFVIGGDVAAPFDSLLRATPRDVRLVMVNGKVLYGDGSIAALGNENTLCEALDVCTGAKFVCVAESLGTASNKLGQSFAEIKAALDSGLRAYDDQNLTPFDFSPIAPLVRCP